MKLTRKALEENISCDQVSIGKADESWNRKITFRRSFFYTNGFTSDRFAAIMEDELREAFPDITVMAVTHGEVWKRFRGGASISQSSHWWATLQVHE